MLVSKVIGKLPISRQIRVDHCILLLKHLSNHNAFYNKRLQMLFKDQLDRSKATCSFKERDIRTNQFLMKTSCRSLDMVSMHPCLNNTQAAIQRLQVLQKKHIKVKHMTTQEHNMPRLYSSSHGVTRIVYIETL